MGTQVGYGELDSPLLSSTQQLHIKTGTIWTAIAHIITGLIGAGVLSLAWSVAQLGWVVGPLVIFFFAGVTLLATFLLCDCYRTPHPETGRIVNSSYLKAVRHYLGPRSESICGVLVKESLFGTGVAYTITAAVSARTIQKSNCFRKEGHQASCSYGDDMYIILFGCVQVITSQIPDFHNMKWLSVVATLMSFVYSTIGVGLGFNKLIENGEIKGSIGGVRVLSSFKKWSLIFQALGDVAFSFPFITIVLEIQDTLKFPAENKTMKRATLTSVMVATFFFFCCACFGYAAFGDDAPGNILTGFDIYELSWLVNLANACIVVHLVGGYQVFSQPVFASVEGWLAMKFSNNSFVNDIHLVKLPVLPALKVNLLRLCFRTTYVVSTTGIAMLFPYFNQVLGVLGAFNFWPLLIYFPVEMYLVQRDIDVWKTKGILLRAFSGICLLVSIVAFAGSVEGLVSAKTGKSKL
ncbi:putative amino acid permease 7 [Silene latifolia]|uniref:putative amino acid permease 7 n=1 Tax=Silene latifolia TaxID=37657 RepID=UPI003D77F5B7